MRSSISTLFRRAVLAACVGAVISVTFACPATAQEDKKGSREREAARRAQQAQQALRKAEEEKAALAREKAELEDKVKAANARIETAEKTARSLQGAVARARKLEEELKREKEAGAALQAKLADAGQRIAAAGVQQTESLRTLASRDSQLKQLQATLLQARTQATTELGVCDAKNAKLVAYSGDLLRLYRDKTAFESIAQAEPLTGLKSVAIENIIEEYRGKIDSQKAGVR